jgi:hypothetical protein
MSDQASNYVLNSDTQVHWRYWYKSAKEWSCEAVTGKNKRDGAKRPVRRGDGRARSSEHLEQPELIIIITGIAGVAKSGGPLLHWSLLLPLQDWRAQRERGRGVCKEAPRSLLQVLRPLVATIDDGPMFR